MKSPIFSEKIILGLRIVLVIIAAAVILFMSSFLANKKSVLYTITDSQDDLRWIYSESSDLIVFHMIPHSHDDLGWIISEQEYSDLIVTHIIRSSTDYLGKNSNAKFSFCDIGFLKHWTDANPDNIEAFRKVVQSGQMEILNGGFAVHDNACVYFDDIINTYEYGREYALKNYGYNPRTGWLIDPFGLSLTTARLYSEMGYEQYVTNRVSDWERDEMRKKGQTEKNWVFPGRESYNILISEMGNYYEVESPMKIDFGFGSAPDRNPDVNILSPTFNFDQKMIDYGNNMQSYISWFPSKHILVPWGG